MSYRAIWNNGSVAGTDGPTGPGIGPGFGIGTGTGTDRAAAATAAAGATGTIWVLAPGASAAEGGVSVPDPSTSNGQQPRRMVHSRMAAAFTKEWTS